MMTMLRTTTTMMQLSSYTSLPINELLCTDVTGVHAVACAFAVWPLSSTQISLVFP